MSSYWETLASRSQGLFVSAEFELASYRLVNEQVLYHADRHSRNAYHLIEAYEREIRTALRPMGVDVQVNRELRYAYAVPLHGKSGTASTNQTLFALVLRNIYDEAARNAEGNDDGEVVCDLVELEEKYRIMTGRMLPGKSELRDLLRTARRWGIARVVGGADEEVLDVDLHGQDYAIMIRHAITVVLGEAALSRLAGWALPGEQDSDGDSGSQDPHESETRQENIGAENWTVELDMNDDDEHLLDKDSNSTEGDAN
jgi:hypothetical protein